MLQNYLTQFVFMNLGGKVSLEINLPWFVSILSTFSWLFYMFSTLAMLVSKICRQKSRKCQKSLENVEKFSTNLGKVNFSLKNLTSRYSWKQHVINRYYYCQKVLHQDVNHTSVNITMQCKAKWALSKRHHVNKL